MKSHGIRSGTRKKFKKQIRHKGKPNISTYLTNYKIGDYVDIVVNSAVNKSMPHKIYHGRTGRVYKVDTRTVGVKVKRIVGNSQIEENLSIRIEHLKKSRCREEFLERSRKYFEAKKEALKKGEVVNAKRIMEGERKEVYLSMENNEPVVVGFEKYYEVF
ncbi:60S ribosomal protein L21A [Gurleya vavrai]